MHTPDRAKELATALQARLTDLPAHISDTAKRELKQLISEYVSVLKSVGFPAERVILSVKRVANEAGLRASARMPESTANLTGEDRLLADIIRWCIEGYYGTPPHG